MAVLAMASKWRNLEDLTPEEIASSASQVQFDNPRAQRLAQSVIGDMSRQAESRQRDLEAAQKEQAREQERAAKEAADAAEAQRAMQVRAGAAQGIKTTTDIPTGKRSLQTHPDGGYVYDAGPVGKPIEVGTARTQISTPSGQTTVPGASSVMLGGAEGALGAGFGESRAVIQQPAINDRGKPLMVQPDTTTDAKTGRQYVSKTDPTTGATVKTAVGIDQAAYDKIQRDQQYQAKAQEIDLRDNNVKQARMRFDPQFKPVADEWTAAKREVEDLPPVFLKQGGVWKYTDPKTLKDVTTFDTAEVERNKALRAKAEQRLATAQQAYQRMSPTAANLERNEKEIKESKLKLDTDRLRQEAGLPEDDGGVAEIIAYDNLLKENKIGADWTPEKHKQMFEHFQVGGKFLTDGQPVAADWTPEKAAEPMGPPRPVLTPDTDEEAVRSAYGALRGIEGITARNETFRSKADGKEGSLTILERDGKRIATVSDGGIVPVTTLTREGREDMAIRDIVNLGATGGAPLYIQYGKNRKSITEEAAEVAGIFSTVKDPAFYDATGKPLPALSARLEEIGATPEAIMSRVDSGDLSVQHGAAILKDLYGMSMDTEEPTDEGFQKYLRETSKAQVEKFNRDYLRDETDIRNTVGNQYQRASQGVGRDTNAMVALKREYLADLHKKAMIRPGYNRMEWVRRMEAAEAGLNLTGGHKFRSALTTGGKLVTEGAIASVLGMAAGAGEQAISAAEGAILGDVDKQKIAEEFQFLRNRSTANMMMGWERNIKAWTTPTGRKAEAVMNEKAESLKRAIDMQMGSDAVKAATKEWQAAALAFQNLAPDEKWPITADHLDPDKDPALKVALAQYMATANPAHFAAFMERGKMSNGRRQLSMELEKKLGTGNEGFFAALEAAQYAGWEEVATEVIGDVATFGMSKALKLAALGVKGLSAGGKAMRVSRALERASNATKNLAQAVDKLGIRPDSLAMPLTQVQRASNTTVKGLKATGLGMGGESVEEMVVEGGSDSPDFAEAALGGAIGSLGMTPVSIAMAVGGAQAGERELTLRLKNENTRYAKEYNERNAGISGHRDITPEMAGVARMFTSDQSYASFANDLADVETQLQAPNLTPEQKSDLTAKRNEVLVKKFLRDDNIMESAREIDEMTDPSRKVFFSGIAKVASGNPNLITQAERSALQRATTEAGAPYFANVNGVDVLTDEARAEIAMNAPAVGALIQTTESQALIEAQAAPPISQPVERGAQGDPATGGVAPPKVSDSGLGIPSPVAETAQPAPTELEAAEYEAARQANPALPEIGQAVSAAFAAGRPVSVSMQKAAGVDVPEGYARQESVWMPPVSANTGPVGSPATTGENAPETPDKDKSRATKDSTPDSTPASTPTPKQSPARQVAEQVKANVEMAMPRLKGRIVISETTVGGGGANIDIESGIITLHVDDIARAIQRSKGDLGKATLYLENIVARHEAVHVVQVDSIRAMWEEEGRPGEFTEYFDAFYDQLGAELLTPEALDAARKIYGKDSAGNWQFDKIASRGLQAAEFTRMLVEAKMDGNTAQFSELLRVVKNQGAKSRLARIIFKAIQILRGMQLTPAAEAHVQQLVELHAELSAPAAKTGQAPGQKQAQEPAQTQQPQAKEPDKTPDNPNALRIVPNSDGTTEIKQGSSVIWRGAPVDAQAELEKLEAAQTSPLLITGNAIKAALEKFPRLAGKLRAELEDAADEVTDELEAAPPGERMALAEKAIADRINLIADREAERTGKDRMEVIEGFRAVAGKRAAKQAASIESAVVGKEAPQIPTGRQEKRDTPNSEMSIDVTSTFVDLDQLIGSSDPLFPGSALQPRNRATQASQNQREEMVQNIRDKDDQHRRYIEGATTDSGRMVVAPLFSADGTHMTNEAGKPLFYVISGNGRRNALKEAVNRKVADNLIRRFRQYSYTEKIETGSILYPVPVSIFVPTSAKEAIDLAEYSNRDAQLSVSNTEQAVRDAASIEKAGILKLWEPDNTGDAAAASNRDFVKAFARAVGDEGVIDNAGNLTEEGAKRIERAMVAMLLGSEQATLLDILFNRASPLGLRAILGGVASETGALLKLASSKPDFDLSPVLANALKTAVEAKQAVSAGQFRDVSEFFDQGSLFESTENTPERQLARAIVESRSRKAVREILAAYRKGAEAVDTSTMSMFAEAETTREDLILKALEARPIEQVIAEIEAEFGKSADLPAKLRVGVAAIKRLDAAQRREFTAAIGAEADRLRAGIISAVEWQRLNPDALGAKEALFQRFLDSHDAKTIASGFNRLLTPKAQAVLGSSEESAISPETPIEVIDTQTGEVVWTGTYAQRTTARRVQDRRDNKYGGYRFRVQVSKKSLGSSAEQVDPRLTKEFGENFEADEYGLPKAPVTLPDGHPLLEITKGKKTATLLEDHPLVVGGYLPAGQVSRKELGRAIIRYFMEHGTQLTGKPTPLAQGTRPVVYATGGGGGAGKSTILKFLQERGDIDLTGAVLVNADDIKEMIPEFEEMKRLGDGRAAATVHEESSQLAKNLLDVLLDPNAPQRFNFIYDATLGHPESSRKHFDRWKSVGYLIHFVGVTIDPKEAMIRAVLRGKGSGRWVPSHMLAEAHQGFNRGVDGYIRMSDRVNLVDNTPPEFHEIGKKTEGEDTISIVNDEYLAILRSRESDVPKSRSQASSRLQGMASGESGGGESGGRSPIRQVQSESGGSGSQGAGGLPGESSPLTPTPYYVRLTKGDKGSDPIEPTGQEEWAKRNPKSAAKLREIIDRQARANNYTTEKVYHGTASEEESKKGYPYGPGDLNYTGTKATDWDELAINQRGAFYVTDDKDVAGQFARLKTRFKGFKARYIELYAKQGNYFDSSNPDHIKAIREAVTPQELKESNLFWDDFFKKNPDGGVVDKSLAPPHWAALWKGDVAGWQVMEDRNVIARLKSLGFEGYRSRELSPDEDNEIDFVSLGVFNPSSVKSADLVTFDKAGNIIPPAARFDEKKPSILYSSAEQTDLFGGIEEAITGPRAKAKRNALEQMRKAPPKAQAGIAKQIAKREGLEDLDLFAAAAVRNLDAKPRRGEAAINASGSGQLGFDFDSGTPAGQQADATRRAGGIRADQATPGRASRSGEQASQPAGEGAASDVQGADSGRSGSGDGSPATDSRDGRGGRAESGNRQGSGQDGGNSSPEAGKRKLVERERPPVGSPERNFTIGKDTVLAEGGTVTRLRNNLAAIDLLRTLEKEGRNATAEEKAVLARYVGWGGIPQVFDEMMFRKVESGEAATRRDTANTYERYGPAYVKMVADYRDQADAIDKWNQKWGDHYRKLKEMLSPEEWTSAQESTINAHYTSPKVISAMWDAVKRLGFLGGNILEPAGGVGHYFGLMPPSIAKRSQLFGVELDSISGRIFGKLYPEGQIEVTGFQDSTIPDNSQSLVISNVPFANINISDAYLDANPDAPKFNLHNYFFEKALRVAQPGGLIAFITTSHTMDSQIAQRKWLAERADFLGAIRLPNNAFKENANTEVVTDIIFLRKPDGTPNPVADSWTATAEVPVEGGKVAINEYFARNPEMILGRLANDGSMYNGREEMTVHENGDLAEQLREAIARLPENVVGDMESAVIERLSRENAAAKDGAFIEENGKLVIKGTGEVVEAKQSARVRSFITLRDTLNSLYLMESDPDATDADISRKRAELNRAYDTFRVIHKELHNPANKKVLSTDPDFYRTLGLETPQKSADGTKTTFTKADVFTKRILEPRVEPTSAESIEDAMIQSLRWKGRLDTKFVGKLMNLTRDQAENQLLGLPNVFRNPATGMLEQSTGYLAGNVRRKLRDAELAAQTNPEYTRNVEELRAAMPADVDWADIQYKIGSTWIPAEVYQDFLREKLMNGTGYPEVIYNKGVGEIIGDSYVVNSPASYRHAIDEQWGVMTKGGAVDKSAFWIAEKVLNQEDPRINRTVEKKQVYDAEATETARASAERMADAFIEWVDANPDLQERLHKIYNESFNSHVIPKYDGSFMQLPWVAKDFDLYPSKKHVVWRALQEGSMLVAHGVGGGKTIIGTAVAMEVRRLGLAKKPMIVVHNATLEQFATTITQMAPTARVLVARKEDLAGGKRKEFMGRIRSGDWDAVVMAHSTFDLIPDDPAWERQQVNELLEELDDAIRAEGADPNETEIRKIKEPSVKELVKMRKRLKDKISKLQDRKTDDVLTFQELGIDTVIVDEAHRYKKMPFVTRQSNIAGIDTGSSQRGTAMHLRSKWIQAQNGGRGVYTMTGTPVTNTLGESWNMIRLVRPDLLKEFAVQTFDRFVSVFGNIKQSGELRPNGQYKPVTRLAEFTNIPEWNRFWGLAADVKMGDDMDVKGRPKIKGGKPALTAVERTPQVAAVIAEITKVIDAYDKMTGKEKRENSHVPLLTYAAARMAAIDVRLVNPEAADDPGSKVNAAIANVMRIYKDTGDNKGTQVIFSDSYRPLKTTKLDLSAAEFEQKANEAVSETENEEGFNLYHDIREKLVKAGVPRSEIAIIGEAKNDKQREIMFEKVNTGEIRIIMGSTETLGTGVNMQKRMFAAHHLDVPWTPAGLEQRDGRVFRQGNMWAGIGTGEIEIMRYGMKDTLDAALWQKLETKERMIKQAVSGEVNARVIEDDAGLLNYMEQKAALSGADGMLKFELDDAVRQFKNQFRTHRNRDYDLKKAMIRAQAQIDAAERNLPELRQAAELVAPLRDVDAQEVGWSIEGGETLKGEKARKALDEMFKARRKKAGAIANAETAPSLRESIRATANGVPVVFRVATISEDLANVANPDQRWQIAWQAYFPGYESASSQASPHPGSNLSAVPALVRNIVAAPDSMERAAAQARKDIENFNSESGKPFPKLAEFRKTLIDQAALYDRMGISRPEGDDLYQNVIGEGWQEKLKSGDKTARDETPANFPGAGLAPQAMTLGSSEESTPDLFTATRRPDAAAKLGQVRVGTMNALGAYRTLTAKREKLGKLTAKEEQQLLDAEVALGQKLAFDMDALKTKTAPPDMRPAIERSTSRMDYSQMEMSRYGETDRKGQMALLSSAEQFDEVYMSAVEEGDMEKAKYWVHTASFYAMGDPHWTLRERNGDRMEMFHGSGWSNHDVFSLLGTPHGGKIREERIGRGIDKLGFWFSSNDNQAKEFSLVPGRGYGKTYRTYLNIKNPLVLNSVKEWNAWVENYAAFHGNDAEMELRMGKSGRSAAGWFNAEMVRDRLRLGGKDGIVIIGSDLDGRFGLKEGDDFPTWAIALDPSQIKSADPVTYDSNGNVIPLSKRFNPANDSILYSSAEEDSAAVEKALASMKPIHRAVFEAVNSGMTPEQVMAKYSISSKDVSNILDQVRSRIASVMKATTADGLTPAMRDGKFDGGRPDLALSTIPQVAAIDQIRNDSDLPGVRAWADILPEAERMLASDYQGTYDRMLAKARNMEQMSDLEVAATKMLISRETMEGRASTPAERVKLALLIHGYRDIGTETARSLAIRRDPHKNPAQRHAQFIAEALFTPDEATRKALRDATPGQQEDILSSWMRRVDAIKQELKARGLDLDASLAAFNEKETARKEAEADSPRTAAIIETQIRKLNRREKAVIEAIRSGALITKAAYLTGLSTDEVKAIYLRFQADMEAAMAAEAKRYMAGALGASADSAMTRIMTDLGLPPLEMIDDTAPDFEAIRKRAKRKESKPRKPKEKDQAAPKAETKTKAEKMLGTPDKPLTPKQIAAIDRFIKAPPSTWRTLWQTDMKNLRPLFGQMPFDNFNSEYLAPWKTAWQEELGLWGLTPTDGFAEWYDKSKAGQRMTSGELFPQDINETTGIFDLNDPKAMMEVRNAFALARGSKMDALMEFWRMSILTGPQTHLVNMGSNALYAAYNLLPRRAVEAGANTVLSAIGMGSQEAATFGEFSAMAKNLRKAIQLGARQALTSWALETRTFESYAQGASLQMDFTGVGGENFEPKLGGKLGKVMRSLSFRAMTAADEFMKLTYGQLEAAANAHRIAKVEEKLTGAAYEARITELMQPGSVAWLRAMDGAKRITFQEDLNGNNPKAIARIDQFAELAKKGRAMPWIGRPLTFFLPFIDTPTNIVKQAIEMSPLGGFLAVIDGTRALRRRYLRGNMSKAEAEIAAGELYNRARFVQDVTNQTIAWTAYFALSGLVKPDDDDEDGRPVITGTQPYKTTKRGERDNAYAVMPPQTIRIGGAMVSYARIEPFASMLAGVVDLMQEIDRNGGTLNGAAASAYAMRLKDQFKDKTFLQGVSDLLNAIEDPERFAENTTANIISGFVPNIVRQPIREADDMIRDTQPREDQGFFGAVARRVGYSVVPQMAPVKMDVWGNEIRANRGKDLLGSPVADKVRRALDPLNSSFGADADPLDAWIFQFNRLTADSSDRIGLSPIPAYITGTVDGKRARIPLTPEEQAEANRNAGQAARSILGDDWDWKTAGTDTALQRADMIKQAVTDAQKFERARLRAQKLMEMTE